MARISRRQALAGATLGAGALMLGAQRRARAAEAGPLRLPFVLSLSGPIAVIGEQTKLGAEITAQVLNRNGGAGGRQIELIFADDKGTPTGAVAAFRELIADGHKLTSGLLVSALMLASLPVLNESKTVLVATGGTSMSLSHEQFTPYFFPGVENDYQRSRAMSRLAAEKLPDVTNWGGLISDVQAYVETYASFQKFCREEYAKAGKQLDFADPYLFKFGTTDFRAQLGQLAGSPIQGLYNMVLGADGLALWQQAQAFNLGGKIKGIIDQTIDLSIAKVLKKRLPPNLWAMSIWYFGLYLDDPFTKAVYDTYVAAKNDKYPGGYFGYGVQAVATMAQAVAAAGSATDTDALIHALETTSFKTGKGIYRYRREDHLLLADINAIRLEGTDEEPGIRILDAVKFNSAEMSPPADPGKPFKL